MIGYIKVAAATIAMITIVCAAWMATCTVVEQQAEKAEVLLDLYIRDFRECMQRSLPLDAPDNVVAIVEEICKEESGLK